MWKRYVPLAGLVVCGLAGLALGWGTTGYRPILIWLLGIGLGASLVFWLYPAVLAKMTFDRIAQKAVGGQLGVPAAGACFIFYPSGDGQTFTASVQVNPLMISAERMRRMLLAHAEIYNWDEREGAEQ